MKKLIYIIEEICDYCGKVVGYSLADSFKPLGTVSKEEGEALIKTIESYHNYYKCDEYTTNTGSFCWMYYFDIETKEKVEEKNDKGTTWGHCRYCGGKTFVTVPRVPGSIFYEEADPVMMCKSCGRIITGNDIVYWEW